RLALSSRFVFRVDGGFLVFTDIDDFDGTVFTGRAAFEHRTWDHFGFGAGLILQDYDVDSGEKRLLGKYRFQMRGLYFYARLAF
ncbi:MAG: hypothetical protein R3190_01290, partial [Thermoanaerobaculia bacterium]|nr:hypothetical protein [Thermoanaerobaculia bacterium]